MKDFSPKNPGTKKKTLFFFREACFHTPVGFMSHSGPSNFLGIAQGSLDGTHLGRIKQCKCTVILRDFPYNSALFGLVI